MNIDQPMRLGIVGSGYISRQFYTSLHNKNEILVTKVLTRRKINECHEYPQEAPLTSNLQEFIDHCDVIYECSGDPIHATEVIFQAVKANKPVITTNSEFHVTTGSYFVNQGLITEAEGDQPGALAVLHERALEMGFKPVAYVNMKGFLDHCPMPENMHYWSEKNGISLNSVTSFTDGTKIQIEQALIANKYQATFIVPGMLGLCESNLSTAAEKFAEISKKIKKPVSDYILFPGAPHGVFLVAEHHHVDPKMMNYIKLGEGPYYLLHQNEILLHLEVPRTIKRLVLEKNILLDNSALPTINVVGVAKCKLSKHYKIERSIGGFDVRGIGVKIVDYPDAVPIGLLSGARLKRVIEPEEILTFDDVELPETLAFKLWNEIKLKVLKQHFAHMKIL